MSRIHDALRRGRSPAGLPNTGRTAHADAVLAALGYRSDKPRAALAALKGLGLVLVLTAFFVWLLIPLSELNPWRAKPGKTGTAVQHVAPAVSVPAPAPKSNPPVVTTPPPVAKPTAPAVSTLPPAPKPAPALVIPPPAASKPAAVPVNPPPPVAKPTSPTVTTSPAAPAAPTIEGRDPGTAKPQNDPRSSILDPRTPVSNPKTNAPALPATKTPAPVVAAGAPRANPVPRTPPASPAALPRVDVRTPSIARPENDPRTSIPESRPAAPAPDEFQLGLYYQRSGDFEQALMHYRAALQRDEMNVEAHNNLGHLYLGKGLFDEAAREFQRVIAIDPKYVTAHVNLSAAYLSLGRLDAAAAEARAALQIDRRNPDAMVNLSLAQNAAGQVGDAQGSLRRALEIDPHNAAAHYNLARQFEAAGEAAAAIDHYRQFIQYAGPEQAAFAADVRTRLAALAARIK